jgi:molybdopterin adenylyltransferase
MKVGRLTASDRASAGVYRDLSGPAIEESLAKIFPGELIEYAARLLPDDRAELERALVELADIERCDSSMAGPLRSR